MELQMRPMSAIPIIHSARLPIPAALPDIQAEILSLPPQLWVSHVNRQDYTGAWDALPLRSLRQHRKAHPILQSFAIETDGDWVDLPFMCSLPAIRDFLLYLQCPLKAVRLMRLKIGAEIKPHRDRGLAAEYGEARLHLPVHTSKDILFSVNNEQVPMRAGELWYINADQVHAVVNQGREDRINLVIDCTVNDWLRTKIAEGATL